ncbi:hypothetical protein [Actinocrispum sp. NPDC049592]|uniref:effector-associated constant component EACC1 n=1 Tax=Actinocrispum sp. NPDC049592 TaxID=3154835 RepID=UPI0034331A90
MDVLISVDGGDEVQEFADLWNWLRTQRELVGAVREVRSEPGETDLGGVADVLMVALGSGGAGVVLAQSLTAWIRTRRPTITLKVKTPTKTIDLTASNIDAHDVLPLLDQALTENDE